MKKVHQMLLSFLLSNSAYFIPLSIFVIAVLMMIFSSIINLDIIYHKYRIGGQDIIKNVGYLAMPNWTILFVFVLPITTLIMIYLIRQVEDTIYALNEERMFVENKPNYNFVENIDVVINIWRRSLGKGLTALLCLLPIIAAYSYWEWHEASYAPGVKYTHVQQIQKLVENKESDFEIDWSIGYLIKPDTVKGRTNPEGVNKTANLIFSFFAFSMQIIAITAVFWYFIITIVISSFYAYFIGRESELWLIPSMRSPDLRRGFEIIEKTGIIILIVGIGLYLMFYLMILQDEFIRSKFVNVFDMLFEPLRAASSLEIKNIQDILIPDASMSLTATLSRIGGVIVIGIGFSIACVMFVHVAQESANIARRIFNRLSPQLCTQIFNKSQDDCQNHLDNMKVWPYKYFQFNTLLGILLLCAIGLIWYRLAPYIYGIITFGIIMKIITNSKKES